MIRLFLIWMLNHTQPIIYSKKEGLMPIQVFEQSNKIHRLTKQLMLMDVKVSIVKKPVALQIN